MEQLAGAAFISAFFAAVTAVFVVAGAVGGLLGDDLVRRRPSALGVGLAALLGIGGGGAAAITVFTIAAATGTSWDGVPLPLVTAAGAAVVGAASCAIPLGENG